MSEHDEIIAETREKYTVHNCGQCEFRKSCNNKFDSDKCKDMRQSIMLGFGIEDGYFTKLLDMLEAAHKREMSDALDTGAFVAEAKKQAVTDCNALNGAKMREALLMVKKLFDGRIMFQPAIREAHKAIRAALAEPPRNCDRFDGDIDLLREACLRERGLNPEEDFPKVFCEWLLEPAKEEEWVKILKILTNGKTKGANDGK